MGKVQVVVSVLLLALTVVTACAPATTPTPQAPAPALSAAPAPAPAATVAVASPATPAWEVEWEKTIAAAKKEGSVVLYTTLGAQQRPMITNAFRSKYGVSVEAMSGTISLLAPKISAEQRIGIYAGDVFIAGSTSYRNLPGALDRFDQALILPDLTETELIKRAWYFGELSWQDKAHTYLASLMLFQQPIVINSSLVQASQITAYRDLLDSKWKGKMSIQDPRVGGLASFWFAVTQEVGDVDLNYMRELLTKQDLFITRDRRLQVEWLARGKQAIAIGPDNQTVTEFIDLGSPLTELSVGTPWVSASTSGTGVMKKAPHPNAAKLFVNWLLSQEGQTLLSQAIGAQSQRLDVPTAHLRPSKVLKPGLKLYRADNEELADKRTTYYDSLTREILGP